LVRFLLFLISEEERIKLKQKKKRNESVNLETYLRVTSQKKATKSFLFGVQKSNEQIIKL
jgi:hypothetical protein